MLAQLLRSQSPPPLDAIDRDDVARGPRGRTSARWEGGYFVTGPYQTRACAIAPVAFFRGVILMLKDIRPPVVSAKHATDMEAEGASASPLEVQTETAPGAGPAIA